ncbi:Peptidyl-prolyl cis-trans isomerase CWC27 [Orchesella cincta]|uniref:Spliceosome-associated protein CWC27 homolog n=1 Tax=Orchesella cincta TaxID=48709 RepID=A0A1D2M8K5_ORCCI|nr:Peptidyl-prolyl cis-trans isomerase CWC27 [Orchesella cincta]
MSNIYIQEPPTEGKVCLETTAGDIDIELWSREAPKACRNFIQLCMEGYYDGTIFHRLVKGFIVQGGDPTGTGTGGNSIWDLVDIVLNMDEFHSRLRFMRRGLVAMANAGKDDNGSQFFFTLGKRQSSRTSIRYSPKNYKLLSFGEEAEEDEEEVDEVNKKFSGKSKSSHDLAKDPKLSSQPALETSPSKRIRKNPRKSQTPMKTKVQDTERKSRRTSQADESDGDNDKKIKKDKDVQSVRDKLKRKDEVVAKASTAKTNESSKSSNKEKESKTEDNDDDNEEYYLGKDEKLEKQRKLDEIRKEYKDLRRSMKKEKDVKQEEAIKANKEAEEKAAKLGAENVVVKEYMDEQQKYKEVKAKAPKKEDREAQTLALLAKFKSKIETAKEAYADTEDPKGNLEEGEEEEEEKPDDISWLARKLQNEQSKGEVLAKDANTKSDDWFDIYDPRNTLTKRRREQSKQDSKEKKRARINN